MNILLLTNNRQTVPNIAAIFKQTSHNVVEKYKTKSVSLISYDMFVICVDFLSKNYDIDKSFFEKIHALEKPTIFVYNSMDIPSKSFGMKFLSDKYGIEFQISDCSIMEISELRYKPAYDTYNEAYSMSSKKCLGVCNIRNTNQFYIMKKENIIIMHDVMPIYKDKYTLDFAWIYNFSKGILYMFEEEKTDMIDWLNCISILDDKKINMKIDENESKIKKLFSEVEKAKEKLEQNNLYKMILCTTGDKLVKYVKIILEEMLSLTINDTDFKKQDLYFKLQDKNILVEVKGVNHPFQRDNIGQVSRHVKDFAGKHQIYAEDIKKQCKGVLILNPYNLQELKDRISKEFYSPEVISDANYENVCTLDTFTLLNYYSKWKNDSKSIDLEDIILNNTYNKPDYNDIINI